MKFSRWTGVLALAAVWLAPVAGSQAGELLIQAKFDQIANSKNLHFVNTTPLSGYCASNCNPGDVSITIPLTVSRVWKNPGAIESQNYQYVDGTVHNTTVTHETGRASAQVGFRLNLLSRRYDRGQLQPGGVAQTMDKIGNGSGVYGAERPNRCMGRRGSLNEQFYYFAWEVPVGRVECSRPAENVPFGPYNGSIDEISVGYVLTTPDPLKLVNGVYRGQISYTVGRGQQIDLGEGNYSDSVITFKFELTVVHRLKAEFPTHRLVLQPPGGWGKWSASGPAPDLTGTLPFRLWFSGPIRVFLDNCNANTGSCFMHNQVNPAASSPLVSVFLTIPSAHTSVGDQPVSNMRLGSKARAVEISTRTLIENQRSLLHFQMPSTEVQKMRGHPANLYRANIRILFESAI